MAGRGALLIAAGSLWGIIGCSNPSEEQSKEYYRRIGDSITTLTQQALLKNVVQAVADSGFAFAIRYCNVHAIPLTSEQAGKGNVVSIQRLTDRNRNPNNKITAAEDHRVFEYFRAGGTDTLLFRDEEVVYYKPIKIFMPTCLKCHGSASDLAEGVAAVLNEKYPQDLARNYTMGELRGMWKVVMKKQG
ncbi:MAG: DUF3365 domain-containing protein [Chitinophagales bacterium]|nr:DUF3365 domain-containing protein [Chitinophagales bacterium]MDW8428439.1 DUF3365 domain-containing protein [Chitinophagales bacterium]